MSEQRRFFSEQPIRGDSASILGAEAHHILCVLRVRVGEEVVLFDGGGGEFVARLVSGGRGEARFEVLSRREGRPGPPVQVAVAAAVPRGPRAAYLVEKCCELGAAELIPLACERGVVDPRVRSANLLDRWRRTVIEACKQCGRNRLMTISDPMAIDQLAAVSGRYGSAWVCDPEAQPEAPPMVTTAGVRLALIGPEGGLAAREVARVREAGFRPLCLGSYVLRIETAAVAALARLLWA
jgi:16S rRNA (uracil1498-N3)-methyltransferase